MVSLLIFDLKSFLLSLFSIIIFVDHMYDSESGFCVLMELGYEDTEAFVFSDVGEVGRGEVKVESGEEEEEESQSDDSEIVLLLTLF